MGVDMLRSFFGSGQNSGFADYADGLGPKPELANAVQGPPFGMGRISPGYRITPGPKSGAIDECIMLSLIHI